MRDSGCGLTVGGGGATMPRHEIDRLLVRYAWNTCALCAVPPGDRAAAFVYGAVGPGGGGVPADHADGPADPGACGAVPVAASGGVCGEPHEAGRPVFVCYAVQESSGYTMHTRFVMRDDFFQGFPWSWLPFDMNEIAEMGDRITSRRRARRWRSGSRWWICCCAGFVRDFPGAVAARAVTGWRRIWATSRVRSRFPGAGAASGSGTCGPGGPVGRTYNPVKKVSG